MSDKPLSNVIVTPSMILEYLEKKCKEQELPEETPVCKCTIMQFQEP